MAYGDDRLDPKDPGLTCGICGGKHIEGSRCLMTHPWILQAYCINCGGRYQWNRDVRWQPGEKLHVRGRF